MGNLGYAQDSTQLVHASSPTHQESNKAKTPPTRSQILAMKIEELREYSLEELTEFATIVGVSSIEELFDLLVTTASKTEEKIIDAPGVVSVLTAREIEQFGARTLKDALNYMTGVGLTANFFNRNGLAIRGDYPGFPNNTHILILIDGRPLRENLFVGLYAAVLAAFPLSGVERIEVIRGPGSVLYGTSAYSGVINVIMKKAKKASLNLTGQGGTFGSLFASADGGFTAGDVHAYGAVNYLNQQNFGITLQTERSQRDTTIAYPQNGIGAYAGLQYNGLTANVAWMRYLADNLPGGNLPPAQFDQSFLFADLGYTHEFTGWWKASLNATFTGYDGTPRGQTVTSRDYIVEYTNFFKPLRGLNVVLGGLANIRTGRQMGGPPGNMTDIVAPYQQVWWSGYAQADYTPFEQLKLIAGAQVNKTDLREADVVPRLGAIWNITEGLALKALYGEAYRAPSAGETFTRQMTGIQGNPRLKAESTGLFDVELLYKNNNLQLSLVYFNGRQDSLIAPSQMIPGRQPNFVNLSSMRSEGVEFEGKYVPVEPLYLLGSVSYQTNLLDGRARDVTPIPNVIARLGAGYTNADIGLSVGVMNIFYGTPNDVTKTNGMVRVVNPPAQAFNLLSVNVNWDVVKLAGWGGDLGSTQILLNARVENALNASAWQPEWTRRAFNTMPLFPGRAFYGGLTVKF
jgi:outer membrane receptor for ferrienterochelin and colicin